MVQRSPSRASHHDRLTEFRSRLESTLSQTKSSTTSASWKTFRSDFKQPMLSPKSNGLGKLSHYESLSTFRANSPRRLLQQPRTQSPLAKFRDNPELFYKKISPARPGTPGGLVNSSASNMPSTYSSKPMRGRVLSDVLRLDDLSRAIEVLEDMTDLEIRSLGLGYTRELMRLASAVQGRLGR